MLVQEDTETIFTHLEFIEIIIELLGNKEEAPPTEDEADAVTSACKRGYAASVPVSSVRLSVAYLPPKTIRRVNKTLNKPIKDGAVMQSIW